jgi:hypothetical protein
MTEMLNIVMLTLSLAAPPIVLAVLLLSVFK